MSLPIRVLTISDCHSDGDSSKWPAPEKGLTRNDGHFLEKIANEKWAKDISHATLGGPPSIAAWRLNRLPDGYAGFEKARPDSKHIDRYIYGHPQGVFRSINEFYPHFKHLMDNGGADGCQCKLCSGNRKRASYGGATSSSNGTKSVSPARRSHYFSSSQTAPSAKAQQTAPPLFNQRGRPNGFALLPQGRLESPPAPRPPRKQIDEDGTPDVIREMLNELKSAEEGTVIDRKIEERLSPDWRMGHELLEDLIDNWKKSPGFVPRSGELVLFARDMKLHEGLAWEKSINSWRKVDQNTGELLARPQWEAGVITQMPEQQVEGIDLSYLPESKSNVTISGFRIEPLSKLGSKSKPHSKQYRYLPLHGIRPLNLWQYCLRDLPEPEWHETVQHSLAALNTLCVVGRKRFKGIRDGFAGPEATIFCQGAYIGSELILTGDTIRLLPNPDEQQPGETTDILIVTAIKLRLVNINEAGSDDWDEGRPYTTCLHLSGRAFTLDPRRCFDGIGKTLVPSDSSILPSGLREYGQWYYMTDPTDSKARLEVPFTRFFSRAAESVALNTWFKSDKPVATFSAVNIAKSNNEVTRPVDVKHGLSGLVQARAYAAQEDPRIDRAAGKSWFWADTRTEALDLHEVNNRFVGPKDDTRTRKQMDDWRKALKALDGSKSGLADYHAAMQKREEEARKEREVLAAGSYGMVGAVVTVPSVDTSGSGTEGEAQAVQQKEDVDMVDPDEDDEDDGEGMEDLAEKFKMKHQNTVIQFSDEDDDDDDDVDDDDDDA